MRAVTALDGFDSSKHSGVISYINRNYVKTGIFDKRLSKILDTAFRLREKADYDDFLLYHLMQQRGSLKRQRKSLIW